MTEDLESSLRRTSDLCDELSVIQATASTSGPRAFRVKGMLLTRAEKALYEKEDIMKSLIEREHANDSTDCVTVTLDLLSAILRLPRSTVEDQDEFGNYLFKNPRHVTEKLKGQGWDKATVMSFPHVVREDILTGNEARRSMIRFMEYFSKNCQDFTVKEINIGPATDHRKSSDDYQVQDLCTWARFQDEVGKVVQAGSESKKEIRASLFLPDSQEIASGRIIPDWLAVYDSEGLPVHDGWDAV